MRKILREILKVEFVVPAIVILIAFIGAVGILPISFEQLVLILLGFLAVDTLVERTTFFSHLRDEMRQAREKKCLRSRDDPDFPDFKTYCDGAQEIFLVGLSLGYVAAQTEFFFEERLRNGCNFRLIVVDPQMSDESFSIIAEHDERARTPQFVQFLRTELKSSITRLSDLKDMPNRTGHLEIRASKGIPVFTITMVNPAQDTGKMRVELRPYKRNQGVRPYFELAKKDKTDKYWYDFFLQHYYRMLWDDSRTLIQF